jgi:hypothetical protein
VKNHDWKKSPEGKAYRSGKEHVPLGTEAVFHWRAFPTSIDGLEQILHKVRRGKV